MPDGTGIVEVVGGVATSPVRSMADVRAALGAEVSLARLGVGTAVHHWRMDESASPFADLGSGVADLAYVAGPREYARAGVYARYGATMQRAPGDTDHAAATISTPSGVLEGLTVGVTIANERTTELLPAGIRIIVALHVGDLGGDRILLLTNEGTAVYVNTTVAGVGVNSSNHQIDWSRPHRFDLTRTGGGTTILYIDGIERQSYATAGTLAVLTTASVGGMSPTPVAASALLMSDFTIHTSVLTPAEILTRADVCRRLAAG